MKRGNGGDGSGNLVSYWNRQQFPPSYPLFVGNVCIGSFRKWHYYFRYPYLCSLRQRGFRGVHLCGVTLLSGVINAFVKCVTHGVKTRHYEGTRVRLWLAFNMLSFGTDT